MKAAWKQHIREHGQAYAQETHDQLQQAFSNETSLIIRSHDAQITHIALKTYPHALREIAMERRHKERKEAERAAVARAERNARRNAKKRAARKRLAADRAVISLYN